MSVITDLIDENSSCHARIVELLNDASYYAARNEELRAELAAIKAQGVVMPPSPYMPGSQPTDFTDYELGEIHGRIAMWEEVKRLNAAPVQQVSVPDGATLILGDTGRKDLDRLIDRLMSSDPDFEDCTAAAALLRRLFMEEISGPKGHATWKDAAVAERLRRVSMRPSETVVAMAREGLAVYSGPNMNEHKVCAEIVRLADISDTAMLAAPAAPSHGEQVRDALAELLECPASVVQATVPHAGIEAAPPYQVVLDVSVSLTRWKKARAALEAIAPAAPAADAGHVFYGMDGNHP